MSLLDKINEAKKKKGIFGIVGGLRLEGKTTIAGTLPGKTIMLQAKLLETGSDTALELAKKNGNDLTVVTFDNLEELAGLISELGDSDYDNIYVDGISAVTEMKHQSTEIQKVLKKNIWDGFRELGDSLRRFILLCKGLSEDFNKNVFITLAYKAKLNTNGSIAMIEPDCKGNVTISEIQRLCPMVLAVTHRFDDNGNIIRQILTKSNDSTPARVDGLLDDQNPGIIEPADLSSVFKLLGKEIK